MLTSTIDAGQQ